MTTVAVSTEPPVIEALREPGRIRVAFGETFGFFGTWLRLLWRHWPALLALALAGTIVRELALIAAFEASVWREGLGGLLVFAAVPAGLLIAMVLMLRVVRSSLPYLGPRDRPESMAAYLGSVLIPFLLFYFMAGYADYDRSRFGAAIGYSYLQNPFADEPEFHYLLTTGPVVAGVAAGAFALRWLFNRFEIVRRRPWLVFPVLYLEVLWIYAAFLSANEATDRRTAWLEPTKAWRAVMTGWHFALDPGHPATPALHAGRELADAFLASYVPVLLAPVTALIAGSVVLAARTRYRRNDGEGRSGLRRIFAIGTVAGGPVGGRFGLIADGTRRVFQAGVVATMLFCLAFVGLRFVMPLLFEAERTVIGERDRIQVWAHVVFPLWWFNEAVGLVLLICLIAAFVDRTAARIARRAGGSTRSPESATAGHRPAAESTGTYPVVPDQPTTRLGPPTMGGATPGTPSYGGFSPVTPTYTSTGQPAPNFGTTFGSGPGLAPPPPSGPPATPPTGLTSGLWDGKLDESGKPVGPADDDRGWTSFGR